MFTHSCNPSIQINANGNALVKVRFSSSWLHPCNAALMLVSRRTGVACGSTLVFSLQSVVNDIFPIVSQMSHLIIRVASIFATPHFLDLTSM